MSEQGKTSLREAVNTVDIEGILEVNELEDVPATPDALAKIKGSLTIGVSETEKYKVNFFASEKTRVGNDNKIYIGLKTVMATYVSKAQALENNLDVSEITRVHLTGKFAPRDYYKADKDRVISYPIIKANFVNKVTKEFNPHATFNTELYFEEILDEKAEDGTATGRLLVNGIIPLYEGRVMPIQFVTTEDTSNGDIANYLKNNYETGKTGRLWGNLNCKTETTEMVSEGFGAKQEKTFTNFKSEYVITGGEPSQYLITDVRHYDKGVIKQAMLYREEMLEGLKENNSTPTSGFGVTASTPKREIKF